VARGLLSVLLMTIFATSAVVFVVALGMVPSSALVGAGPLGEPLDAVVAALTSSDRLGVAAFCAAAAALSLALLIRIFRPYRAATHHVVVADEYGFVLVDSHGVEAVASAAALRAPGVVDADVRANGSGTSPVRLAAVIGVHPGASLEEAGRAARELARNAVERLVGLHVSDVTVDVQVLDPEELGRALS